MRSLLLSAFVVAALGGCGQRQPPLPPATEPTAAERFAEAFDRRWCQEAKDDDEIQKTVNVLLYDREGRSDCRAAAERLYSRSQLNLAAIGSPSMPKLKDLRPLAGLVNATILALDGNELSQIRDLIPLKTMTRLRVLTLLENSFERLDGLRSLAPNLETLNIGLNPLKQGPDGAFWSEAEERLPLKQLYIDRAGLTAIPSHLPRTVEYLTLGGNPLMEETSLFERFETLSLHEITLSGSTNGFHPARGLEELRKLQRAKPAIRIIAPTFWK